MISNLFANQIILLNITVTIKINLLKIWNEMIYNMLILISLPNSQAVPQTVQPDDKLHEKQWAQIKYNLALKNIVCIIPRYDHSLKSFYDM